MDFFTIRHTQTGTTKIGTWDEICDYDKRIWEMVTPPVKLPLAIVPFTKFGPHPFELGKPVNSIQDLVGVYVG